MSDKPRPIDLIVKPTGSAALDRLIAEVRAGEQAGDPTRYNRVYSRHNRS